MSGSKAPAVAAAAATAAFSYTFGQQLFVTPASSASSRQQEASTQHLRRVPAASGESSSTQALGLGLAAGTVLSATASRANGAKVVRNFFGDSGGSSYARAFDPATELGVQDPIGFWDPLGLAADKDEASFKRRRAVEIKHGRISMYATIGYIVPEYFKFPGYLSPSLGLQFSDVPNGLAALSKLPVLGGAQIIAFAGLIETTGFFQAKSTTDGRGPREGQFSMKDSTEAAEPGNYGVGFPNFLGKVEDPEARKTKLAAELANGRLAMMAIIGMFFQDGLTGSAWGDWALYTASPLRAFESELGVQAPVGFWDPAGFTKDGDQAKFKRRRSIEIKHGRIAMLATMGYITPEVAGKWGGLCADGLPFSDIPNGLAALKVVPFNGWLQMFLYCGAVEASSGLGRDAFGDKTPGDMGWKPPFFKDGTPEKKKTRLAAELANGRLAMMAIIGMFFQDGLTGSAWGDWANYTDSPLRAFEGELGVQAPLGYWDPLGFSKDGDAEVFYRRRCTEIKNGRVAMIAAMGYIAPEYFRFPGYCSPSDAVKFTDIPNGLAALEKLPAGGWGQWIAFCGFLELYAAKQDKADPPGLLSGADEGFGRVEYGRLGFFRGERSKDLDKKRGLNSELANGRLAMMAIIGMFFQDGLTGSAWGDWANYSDSPLRAFEGELGVQAPVGFFDPLGFTKDGDETKFKRRRQVELKNGRVAMWATLGYIVPEYFRWPGFLSPSADIKFTEVPNGLEAMSKIPLAGGLQMFFFAGFLEWGLFKQDSKRAPGDFENVGDLGVPFSEGVQDPEDRKRKLNAELANGRLAMFAITGMLFQNGFLGTTGPEMWSPSA